MPNYDYRCDDCGHTFEQMELIANRSKPTKKPCPECGKKGTVEQVIGCPSAVDPMRLESNQKRLIPGGFKEVLRKIHEKTPGSTLDKTKHFD